MSSVTPELAHSLLMQEAERIRSLIKNQKNSQCISQCKAFEEVVDTQMYGLSRQITFAVRLGIIKSNEGNHILSELERELNRLYTEVYQEQKIEKGREE